MTGTATTEVLKGGPALAAAVDACFKTRTAFAHAAGITPSDASRFCSGTRVPSATSIRGICTALGIATPEVDDECFPRSATEKGLERKIVRLLSDLALERQAVACLEASAKHLRSVNRRLRATLERIRNLAEGSP